MTVLVAIGVGGSGHDAGTRVELAIGAVGKLGMVVGRSRRYENPAWGGVTRVPFVNACVIVETTSSLSEAMMVLKCLERRHGRVRATKNAPRTLDLDLVWWSSSVASQTSSSAPHVPNVPHPRLMARSFVLVPLMEAFGDARMVAPLALAAAARKRAREGPLRPMAGDPRRRP
jgi:2-amino-4-hydroxy-6-hydroxymethyldihydropteridine diphosphokinase